MDLHIDGKILVDKSPVPEIERVDPYIQASIDAMFVSISITENTHESPWYILPGMRVLMSTLEVVTVSEGWVGLICLRSTWARLGLISPPTLVDPGFQGNLTMELFNASEYSIAIRNGEAIWSMTRLLIQPGSEEMYQGRYQGQRGVTIPKALRHE